MGQVASVFNSTDLAGSTNSQRGSFFLLNLCLLTISSINELYLSFQSCRSGCLSYPEHLISRYNPSTNPAEFSSLKKIPNVCTFHHFPHTPLWSQAPSLLTQATTIFSELFYPSTHAFLFLNVIMSFSSHNFSCSWEKSTFLSAYFMPGIMLDSRNNTIRKLTSSFFSVSQKALTNLNLTIIPKSVSALSTSALWEKTCPGHFSARRKSVTSYGKHTYEAYAMLAN